jgi:hypothetical protein
MLSMDTVTAYRAETYRMRADLRISTREEAVAHVNARGFVFFWPISNVVMPSLWAAAVGDRPVPNNHDDPGHVTWSWKDSALGERLWYYGKILRRKATMISLDVAPYFYSLSENFGSPEEDYLDQYRDGAMTLEAKVIYEALLREGPLNAVALRRATSLIDEKSSYRFNRGLDELQADFKVMPIGVAEAGAWNYAFIYECVHRYHPEFLEQARDIQISEAQRRLVDLYFQSVGAAKMGDIVKVFWWPRREVEKTVDALVERGVLVQDVEIEGQTGTWVARSELVS